MLELGRGPIWELGEGKSWGEEGGLLAESWENVAGELETTTGHPLLTGHCA